MMKNTQHKKRIRLKGFDYTGQFRYSLTFCTKDKAAYFDEASAICSVAGILRETSEKHGFRIWSFCFMPDHLHVLVEGEHPSSDLKKFVSLFKQKSGYWFRLQNNKNVGQGFSPANKATPSTGSGQALKGRSQEERAECKDLWQINYYEHILRSEEATEKVARYILDNPDRKGMVEDYRSYPFSWCDIFGFVGQGFSLANNNKNVGQGFSPANKATPSTGSGQALKACPPENHEDGDAGQGVRLAESATLIGGPTKKKSHIRNPKGLPYNGGNRISNAGFTLIEIVMTIVLMSVLAALAAVIILQGVRAYTDEDSRSDIHYQTRLAVERVAREARQISACTTINVPANPGGAFSFFDINTGATVTFSISGTDLFRNADRLASGITSPLPFRFLQRDGLTSTVSCTAPNDIWFIDISVTDASGSQSLPVRTRVHPRNF